MPSVKIPATVTLRYPDGSIESVTLDVIATRYHQIENERDKLRSALYALATGMVGPQAGGQCKHDKDDSEGCPLCMMDFAAFTLERLTGGATKKRMAR